jgi:hypothetical protein
MITPNPPPDDSKRPQPPSDTRITGKAPPPPPPFPVDEKPVRRRREDLGRRSAMTVGLIAAALTLLACGGGVTFISVVCGNMYGPSAGVTTKLYVPPTAPADENDKLGAPKAGPP